MSQLTRILYTFASIAVVVYIATAIFSFFGVGIQTYGVYLLFIKALAIFNSFLPAKSGLLFTPK